MKKRRCERRSCLDSLMAKEGKTEEDFWKIIEYPSLYRQYRETGSTIQTMKFKGG